MKRYDHDRFQRHETSESRVDFNFVGKRIMFSAEIRVGKIVELFDDLHYIVEFEDNGERREINVKEIRIGGDVIK